MLKFLGLCVLFSSESLVFDCKLVHNETARINELPKAENCDRYGVNTLTGQTKWRQFMSNLVVDIEVTIDKTKIVKIRTFNILKRFTWFYGYFGCNKILERMNNI